MRHTGRYLDISRALNPDRVKTITALMSSSVEACETLSQTVSATVFSLAGRRHHPDLSMCSSATCMIRAIILTDSHGYCPLAVSADSITASLPSKIAFATSLASARVGRGLVVIDSSIWVAVLTGILAAEARSMID